MIDLRRATHLLLAVASTGAALKGAPPPTVTAVIRTQQTQLTIRAGETAPEMVSLGSGRNFWQNSAPDKLIDSVFLAGRPVPVRWQLNAGASHSETEHSTFVYDCASPKLRLTWEWAAHSVKGPVEHTISIQNLSSNETIWIPLQDSFQYRFAVNAHTALKSFYVEKGAGKPSDIGTHHEDLAPNARWAGFSSTYAHTGPREPREIIPFVALENQAGRSGWYVGIEFSGRTKLSIVREGGFVYGAAGLNGDGGAFRTRLNPGDKFETPTVFAGAFSGGLDELGNTLRPWIRQALGNPRAWQNPNYPLLVNNSWGSGMEVNEATAQRMIRDSAELGLEMFHVDAGWFRGVGDWYPNPTKFPHGLSALADYAHQLGLKFGLWVDWTQAALDKEPGALNLREPKVRDWTVFDLPPDWKPEPFKGQTIDIGEPAARAYAQGEALRIVRDYRLDMLEHDGYLVAQGCVRDDHPHAPPDPKHLSVSKQDGSYIVESSNSTDVSYHAVRAYYDIHSELRRQHPNLLLEVCNDGGRMVDFGSAAHGDYFSITDAYDPVSNRRAFYDASYLLPAPMLESYVEKWPAPRIENFRYMLRSGMMGWLTIMQDTNAWTAQQHSAAKLEFELYRERLRPLIRDGSIYHVSDRPDGVHWDGIEYFDRKENRGVLYAFHGSDQSETEHIFVLPGLTPHRRYTLHFQDSSNPDQVKTGRDLMVSGLAVKLPIPNSSELVFISAAPPGPAQ